MKVKLDGFRELEKALAEVPKATGKSVLRRVGKGALEPMAQQAVGNAPIDEGDLRASIAVSEKRTPRARTRTARQLIGGKWRSGPTTSIDIAMGPAGGRGALHYATFVEFGTVDTAAHPFMRPAWEAGKMRALDYVKSNLKTEIDKAAARHARKLAKQRG